MGETSKFTPGPWRIESEPYNVWDAEGRLICRANAPFEPDSSWERGCANARLIAASPDLLAACKEAESIMAKHVYPQPDKPDSLWGVLKMLRAAVAKAEGAKA